MHPPTRPANSVADHGLWVSAPARLHLGFLDLNGGYGRRYGSLGLAISGFQTTLSCRRSDRLRIEGTRDPQVRHRVEQLLARFAPATQVELLVEEQIPAHAGLGSGTQLQLAIISALLRVLNVQHPWPELVALSERGQRSGIGIGCFEQGGFVIDGGRGASPAPPPVLARMDFPVEWRILLVLDPQSEGLSGGAERHAFTALPPMSEAASAVLCRRSLMQVMPALRERDFVQFVTGVEAIQRELGAYFAPAQNGCFSSPRVARAMASVRELGGQGIGQSSWGPTGFAFFPTEASAERALADLMGRYGVDSGLRFVVVMGRNQGAEWTVGRGKGLKAVAKGAVAPA